MPLSSRHDALTDGAISQGRSMADKMISALLAALNESAEIKGSDWPQLQIILGSQFDRADALSKSDIRLDMRSENRFAAMVCSGMAKARSDF